MSLGHGANNQLKGSPKLTERPPWRNVPQAAGEGLSSDGNTTSLAPIDDGQVLANTSGDSDIPVGTNLTDYLDYVISADQGTILFRNAATWIGLPPGTSGWFLETQGPAADIVWAPISSGPVTAVGPPVSDGVNLFFALTNDDFPSPQVIIDGSGNPIYVTVL